MFAGNFSRRLQSVHIRHGKIQHDYIGLEFFGFVYCLMPIARVSTHCPASTGFDQPAEQTPDCSIVIGDEYSDWHSGYTDMNIPKYEHLGETRPSTFIMMPCTVLGAIPSLPDYCRSYIRLEFTKTDLEGRASE